MVDLSIGNNTYNVTVDETTFSISVGTYAISGALNDLTDVDTSGVSDGQLLSYESSTGTWVPVTASGTGDMIKAVYDTNNNGIIDNAEALGGSTLAEVLAAGGSVALDDVTDVTITTLGADELLFTQDGSTWVNQTLSEAGISAVGHSHTYSDVSDFQTGVEAFSVNSLTDLGLTASSTELNYVDGVTSAIQTQLDGKASSSHSHTLSDITDSGSLASQDTVTLTSDVTGVLPIANGGTAGSTAALARAALDVDQAGTDNSTPVTLAGALDYITLSGQELTRNAIDLTTDVSGFLPVGNIVTSTGASSTTFLRGDGSWATPSGSGDVSKVGTPVDNQVGVWTGDGTIEGTTGLTYNGTTLDITGNITLTGTVDGVDIATDVAANTAKVGVTTQISNVVEDTTPQLGGNLDGGANDISINSNQKIIFDGSGGNTYLSYNSSTSKLELYVDGVKKMQWG